MGRLSCGLISKCFSYIDLSANIASVLLLPIKKTFANTLLTKSCSPGTGNCEEAAQANSVVMNSSTWCILKSDAHTTMYPHIVVHVHVKFEMPIHTCGHIA
jgi:hypothetical protein